MTGNNPHQHPIGDRAGDGPAKPFGEAPPCVAAIDVGSNTIKLLVARRVDGHFEELLTHTEETRVGEHLGKETAGALPRLTEAAIARGTLAIAALIERARPFQPRLIRLAATSAVRDAVNGTAFAQQVETATGHPLHIISGNEEALMIARGIALDPALHGLEAFLLADLGGGSLETVLFRQDAIVEAASLPLGAVRLSRRFCVDPRSPVSSDELHRARAFVDASLQELDWLDVMPGRPLVIAGGAMTFARRILASRAGLPLPEFPPEISRESLEKLTLEMAALDIQGRMVQAGLPENRAEVFPVALATLAELALNTGAESLTHTFHNLRFGLALDMLEELEALG